MRRAEPHMDPCGRAAAGEEPYTWALDARLAAITREAMVQCWEAVEQNLLRTIGASAARNGEPFERLLPAPGDVGGAPQHAAAGGLLPPGGRACGSGKPAARWLSSSACRTPVQWGPTRPRSLGMPGFP